MRNFFIFLTLFYLLAEGSVAQSIKVEAALDTNSILIGDQVELTLGITIPEKSFVHWPLIGDTILSHIKVISRTKIDTSFSTDHKSKILQQKFLLTTFDSGFYPIPPVRFFVSEPPDSALVPYQSETLLLSVHTVPVDTTKAIKPIKGPIKVPISFRDIFPWILAGILFISIVYFVIYYLRKRKKAEPVFQLKPRIKLKPHEIALAGIEKLRIKKLWQSGRIKEYHTEMTEIVRKYIEDRFGIMALEMTSDEILDSLDHINEPVIPSTEKLSRVFTLADLVKFAKAIPLPTEHEQSMENTIVFINETTIKIPETQAGNQLEGFKNT